MIALPAKTRIWIAAGVTDLRRGFTGLSALVQTKLEQSPFSGHVFVFRGRRGDLIKVLWYDGDGLCLFTKRLERGRFVWPLVFMQLGLTLSHSFSLTSLSSRPGIRGSSPLLEERWVYRLEHFRIAV
jgi:transposase